MGNFGPQAGFVFSPGLHKTAIRAGIGIFYENNAFNNTANARRSVVNASGPFFNDTPVCGGTYTVPLPGGGSISDVNGVPLSVICNESIADAAPALISVKDQYQAATKAHNDALNPSYIGGLLGVAGIYGAPYLSPYSIQFNGGLQQDLGHGIILSADYVHNATIKVPLEIDVNHVGAARYLNTASAKAAIAATTDEFGCLGGSSAAAINCAIASGAQITDFAINGLDSGNQVYGGYPASLFGAPVAAFPGANPNVGLGQFILPIGRSGYDALQVVMHQVQTHPMRGVESANFQLSYSFSRIVTVANNNQQGSSDQFFNSLPYDYDNPNLYMGRASLDHTHELSFGGAFSMKYGLQVGVIGHFYSAPPTTLSLDSLAQNPGEIFRTDVTGDGTIGDLVPGTLPGDYMHSIKGSGLNKLINGYNSTHAGQPTPAGTALISAGLFTPGQLLALNGVQQPIATAPTTPLNNPAFRTLDLRISYPISLSRLREGMSLQPGVTMYNVTNMSNFGNLSGTLLNTADAGGSTGSTPLYLNGPNTFGVQNGTRVQRGSGTFDQGGPRSTEFQLRLNF